jgi:hypothetical protein
MKTIQFVETTKERFEAHVAEYTCLTIHGGRYQYTTAEDDQSRQVRHYHNPCISDIGQKPQWYLIAFALENRFKPEHSQFFMLKVVEMGVHYQEVGFNG